MVLHPPVELAGIIGMWPATFIIRIIAAPQFGSKRLFTMQNFMDHLADDVLPPLLDKLSSEHLS
jgi:hypothetical protein